VAQSVPRMVETSSEEYFCPALERQISSGLCWEYSFAEQGAPTDAADELRRLARKSPKFDSIKKFQNYCETCRFCSWAQHPAETNPLSVRGEYKLLGKTGVFLGMVSFRKDTARSIYYECRLASEDGDFLCNFAKSTHIGSLAPHLNAFAFAIEHAIEAINEYRINRNQPFLVHRYHFPETSR